ncbi:hypothetical protein OSB04_016170 [Centaurea solstitialis]|uniref:MATH domain-containing protein n=1 Tax=Centaurea solstitialis TaxID=347529 RepID=A0AA38WH69_9ASTR|nr:hypothetical protein OSB04_016170 [Centaurea solstitialis]
MDSEREAKSPTHINAFELIGMSSFLDLSSSLRKRRLDLYSNGNEEEKGGNHISLYVIMCGTQSLPKGWEVCVDINFFIYDHVHHNYVSFQDIENGNRTRFHEKKLKWGFDKLISLDSFKNCENGYLLNDSCVFGVEVFAIKEYFVQNDPCLSMTKPPPIVNTHIWRIDNFLDVTERVLHSEIFKFGNVKWKLSIFPKGTGKGEGEYLSIFLMLHDAALLPDGCRVFAKHKLRLKNQSVINIDRELDIEAVYHHQLFLLCFFTGYSRWFDKSSCHGGFPCFMPLNYVKDPRMGFLLNRSIIVEAEFLLLGMLKKFI